MIFFYRIIINFIIILSPLIILIRLLKKRNIQLDLRKNSAFFPKKEDKENLYGFMEQV